MMTQTAENPKELTVVNASISPIVQAIKFSRLRKLVRGLSFAAVGVDVLFSAFMYETAPQGAEVMLWELGMELTPQARNSLKWIILPLVFGNLLNDLTAVDVAREADDLTLISRKKKMARIALNILILEVTLKALALVSSYPIGGSADALPLADWITIRNILMSVLLYSCLAIISSLETLYYVLFLNPRLQQHASSFVNTLKNFPEFCRLIVKHPSSYAEVIVQVSANAINRAIKFAFIMQDVLWKFFYVSSNSRVSRGLSITAGVNTGILTLFSRFLSTYKQFLKEEYQYITPDEYKKSRGLGNEFIRDALFSLIRGGSVGLLMHQLLWFANPWNYVLATCVSSIVFSHSAYSHYVMRRQQHALQQIDKVELKKRILEKIKERQPLLETKEKQGKEEITEIDPGEHKNQLFDEIAKAQNSAMIKLATRVIVNSTQLVRLFAFFLFVLVVNDQLLNSHMSPLALFAFTLLWGCEVFKNDGALYQNALTSSWTGMAARWELEKYSNDNNNNNAINSWHSAISSRFYKLGRVLTKSPYDYSDEVLEAVREKFVAKPAPP